MISTATTMLPVVMAAMLLASTSPASMKSFYLPTISSNRSLGVSASEDFSDLNKIFENASIFVPKEFKVSEEVASVNLDMNIRNIKCYGMTVGHISIDHEQNSDTEFFVTVGVAELELTCEMDYDYSYGMLSGDGFVRIHLENSEVISTMLFTSLDFDQDPPTNSAIDNCISDVEIKNMVFEEDVESQIFAVFPSLILNTAEIAISDVACEELSVIGTTVVGNMVDMVGDQLEPYLGHLGEAHTVPLYLEDNLHLPDSLEALNIQGTEGNLGKTFKQILQLLDTYLATTISNSSEDNADSSSTGDELVINSLLRSFILNDDGSLRLDPSSISTMMNPVLFEGHDRLTEFTITLNEVRLYGLDSISRFGSFRSIGKYTLENELTWDMVKFEFDIILDIKPSKLDDAILKDSTSTGISELFSMDFTVNNIDVEASLLVVLDEIAMGSVVLGQLFYAQNLLKCFQSIVHEVKLSGLDVDPSYIIDGPTIDGFISSGLDLVISDSIEAAFAMYKGSLRAAIPNIFQTSVRELISAFIAADRTSSKCPESHLYRQGILDFREFFKAEGKSYYGDLPLLLKNMLDDGLLTTNPETGRPRINEALIAPLTGVQSGIEGTLMFPTDFINFMLSTNMFQNFGMETLELRVFDAKIENLDTVGTPVQLLEPSADHGQVLYNNARLGSVDRKLRIGLKGLLVIEGDPALTMNNELDMFVELAGADAFVSLMATVDVKTLFNFPLRDITNLQCWLNTFTPLGLTILNALLTTTSMTFNVTCANCTSSSLSILPEILDSLEAYSLSDFVEEEVVKLMLKFVRSDYIQDYIDGILMDAAIRCPHSPKFIGSSASISENPTATLPFFDNEALETIVLVSTVIAATVIAQAHESYDLNTTFPLSGQYDLNVTNHVQLVDFTSLETSLVDFFVGFLNDVVERPHPLSDSQKNELRVNSLIRSLVLDENREFSVSLNGVNLEQVGLGISLKEIRILELDTISEFDIFDAIGAQTIQSGITWKNLGITLVLSLEDSYGRMNEEIRMSATFRDVNLSLAILMAINVDLFESLEMFSIMELENILPCILSTAETASFTELELSIGEISFDSSSVEALNRSNGLIDIYRDKIISSIPKVFDASVRTLLNNWLKYQVNDLPSDFCKYPSSYETGIFGFVDLRDLLMATDVASLLGGTGLSQYGDMFTMAMSLIQDVFKINESTELSGFNEAVVGPLTRSLGNEPGTIHYSGDLFKGENSIKVGVLDTNVQFRVYDAKIENLNTVGGPLDLLSGIMGEAYMLNSTLTAGVEEKPLQFSSKVLFSLEGEDNIDTSNDIDLSLELTDVSMIISTLTKIAETKLFSFPLRDVFDLNCWLATIPEPVSDPQGVRMDSFASAASPSYLKAHIGELTITADCRNCTSPIMNELTDLFSSPEARNETTDVANALLDYVTPLMGGNFLQFQIDRVLNEAVRKCPHSPSYEPNATLFIYEAFEPSKTSSSKGYLIFLTVFILTMIIILLTFYIVRRRHRKWIFNLSPHQIKNLSYHQKSKHYFEDKLNIATRSMFLSPDVPHVIRFTIPIVILCNVFFFLSGHLSVGASVNIEAEVAGEKYTIEEFFEFSMARSTIDIWKAGGQEIAILIFGFSGIWPYTKLMITLCLWFTSPSNVSISRRGSILLWLEWLTKWSMIDILVLVISIAAFRISIESPNTSYLPNAFYAIEMMVVPRWGLYANMTAQLISQLTNHVVIHYHRRIVLKATERLNQDLYQNVSSPASIEVRAHPASIEVRAQSQDPETPNIGQEQSNCASSLVDISVERSSSTSAGESMKEKNVSLSTVRFSRPHRGESERLIVRGYVNKLLLFCGFSIAVCVVAGCILPSFSLSLFGLVGVAVEFGQDFKEATVNHSVFSVIKLLFDQASYLGTVKNYLGLIVLSILFVSTILFVPIIQSITLLHQWYSVSTQEQKRKIAVRLRILQAWQYLEVYLVALFISSWQLGPFSDFMIHAYCKNLEAGFAQMVYYGVLKEEDAQCFGITSQIGFDAFVLAAGAILLTFLRSFVSKAVVQYLRDETPPELRHKGKGDFASQSKDGDEVIDAGVATNIGQTPVLFTDIFRWMLKSSDSTTSTSKRTLYLDHNNSHGSFPEATVVTTDNSLPEGRNMKGTYVHNLASEGKVNIAASGGSPSSARGSLNKTRQGSIDSASAFSFDAYQSSQRGKELIYDDDHDELDSYIRSHRQGQLKIERRESTSSLGQDSIVSQMDSIGSSFDGEDFEASSIESPPAKAVLAASSQKSSRRA